MTRNWPILVALGLVLASGLVHGLWSDRWRTAEEPAVWAARLAEVPMRLGGWQGEPLELDPKQVEVGEFAGYLLRRYVHPTRGEATVAIVCGRPGPIAVHTPDVCFRGNGQEMLGLPVRWKYRPEDGGEGANFWVARFKKNAAGAPIIVRALWAWSDNGDWQAPGNPRIAYARSPGLYKLYVLRPMTDPQEPLDKDGVLDLLQRLLPELKKTLFAA